MNKLKLILKYFPYIFHIIYFNFNYLPIKQAIKLPILLYKPKFIKCKGNIKIEAKNISFGMIKLGIPIVSVYPFSGISIELLGNVIFKGTCLIGNCSFLSVAKSGTLTLGERFSATSSLKLVCYKEIQFGADCLIGWENLFCDTDFHSVKQLSSNEKLTAFAPIYIGSHNWFAMKCTTLKGTKTPDNIIIGANSLLTKDYSNFSCNSIIAGHPVKLIKENVYRDPYDDSIEYTTLP